MQSVGNWVRQVVGKQSCGSHAITYRVSATSGRGITPRFGGSVTIRVICTGCRTQSEAFGVVVDGRGNLNPTLALHVMRKAMNIFVDETHPSCKTTRRMRKVEYVMES
jgi:hypothetical protein